ncbi:MAG: DUF749 family protein [Thermoplasmata archaeon]
MHVARLVFITEAKNVPPDLRPFVEFKAAVEERALEDNERIAMLVIETTTCYIPVFLRNPVKLEELEKELERQDAKLSADTRDVLSRHLKS